MRRHVPAVPDGSWHGSCSAGKRTRKACRRRSRLARGPSTWTLQTLTCEDRPGEAPAVRGFETCSACSRGDHGRIGAVGGLGHRDSVQSVLLVEALHLLVLVCWYIDDCVDGQRR